MGFPIRSWVACLAILAGCGRPAADARENPLTAYTAEARANPPALVSVGGINMWGYCVSRGYPAVGYRKGVVEGSDAALDNWVCQRGTEQLKPSDWVAVDMAAACRWQNGRDDVIARPTDANHAWSWECYSTGRDSTN